MRWTLLLAVSVVLAAQAQEAPALKTTKDKTSYAMGIDLGKQLRKSSVDIDTSLFLQGLKDGMVAGKGRMSDDEVKQVLSDLGSELKKREFEKRHGMTENPEWKMLATDNKLKGAAFLAENAKKEGVVTLPSGLQYKILKAGHGTKPSDKSTVVFNYRSTYIDGREIDSTYRKDKGPLTRVVSAVLPGWREGLLLMSPGAKYQFYIPSSLAYGEAGSGGIGPNTTILAEVELLEVK
jgi:FKBP-type peptidyl-prolyl cis-trans isomerase FklB